MRTFYLLDFKKSFSASNISKIWAEEHFFLLAEIQKSILSK